MLVVPLTSLLQVGALFFFSVLTIDKKKEKKTALMAEIVSLFYSKSITSRAKREFLNRQSLRLSRWSLIDHFTVVDLVPWPSSECEADGDLVLIQTPFALLWKLSLKNTNQHKNNLIYLIKQEGLYQNKVTASPASIHAVKWPIDQKLLFVLPSVLFGNLSF